MQSLLAKIMLGDDDDDDGDLGLFKVDLGGPETRLLKGPVAASAQEDLITWEQLEDKVKSIMGNARMAKKNHSGEAYSATTGSPECQNHGSESESPQSRALGLHSFVGHPFSRGFVARSSCGNRKSSRASKALQQTWCLWDVQRET